MPGCVGYWFIGRLGSLAGFAQASLATGADIQANAHPIHDNALLMHVRAEIPTRAALGETHIISESLGFATDITLPGHGQLPSKHLSRRYDSGSKTCSAGDARKSHYQLCTGAPEYCRTGGNTTLNASINQPDIQMPLQTSQPVFAYNWPKITHANHSCHSLCVRKECYCVSGYSPG